DRELFQQDAKPSELFRRQCFVSVEPEEELAKHVIAELGDDNLVVSTDWPHDDSRYPHALDTFLELGFSKDAKRKILWDNCARPYKLWPDGWPSRRRRRGVAAAPTRRSRSSISAHTWAARRGRWRRPPPSCVTRSRGSASS